MELLPPNQINMGNVGRQFEFDVSTVSALFLQLMGILLATITWGLVSNWINRSMVATTSIAPPTNTPFVATAPSIIPIIATLRFQVSSSINGQPIPEAQVSFKSDVPARRVTGLTDENGFVTLENIKIGQKGKITIVKEGFARYDSEISAESAQLDVTSRISLSVPLADDENKRFVLAWGPYFIDLDTYMYQIDTENNRVECFLYFSRKICSNVELERDVTRGTNGAETTRWTQEDDFDYAIVVAFAGGERPLIESEARVTLFGDDGSVSLSVPQEEPSPFSRYWIIGCVNGSTGIESFREVNKMVSNFFSSDALEVCSTA